MLFSYRYVMHVPEVRQQPERITCARSQSCITSCDRQCTATPTPNARNLFYFSLSFLNVSRQFEIHLLHVYTVYNTASNGNLRQRLKLFYCDSLWWKPAGAFVYRHTDSLTEQLITFYGRRIRPINESKAIFLPSNIRRGMWPKPI